MTGGFDAGEALRGGLDDRRQAWDFIGRFAAEWAAPLAAGDGVSRDVWRAAEQHIGAELPAALREAYLLFGRRPDLMARQDRLVPPHQLELDESGTFVVLSEVLLGRRELDMCELPGELIPVVESAWRQMAVPEYRLWADRSLTVRWFSAPGKLLRMDGRGPYCWVIAGGQTPADLESIRAAIPGRWTSAPRR